MTDDKQKEAVIERIPVLPLRDVVVYPHMVIPLFVGRQSSVKALEVAMNKSKQIFLTAQRKASIDNPGIKDLYKFGTFATILQLLKLPDGTVKVLIEGIERGHIQRFYADEGYFSAEVASLEEQFSTGVDFETLERSLMTSFEQYVKLNKKIPPEVLTALSGIDDIGRLIDTIAAHMTLKIKDKQKVLELLDVKKRLKLVATLLATEIDIFQVEQKVQGRVKRQMEKSQREYYLNEKMKAIQKELASGGKSGESSGESELEQLEEKIEKAGMSKEAKEKALAELNKMKMMPPMAAEATVLRNYIDWLVQVPWKNHTKINKDLKKAQEVLDKDHWGLEKVKERILEYIAVQQRVDKLKGPILCLVGPPGVGKTSLGQSIARAVNREFARISLGGVRDEAEIRGHRRTYIGALPGKIIQKMTKTKVRNPLFMLDEVDKMSVDFRGDPASALLEVLDPEQNHTFNDHYLEVDYDLSDVMFIATANTLNIPPPLLDRMEVIRLSGYTEDEKANIAMRYLIPKQVKDNGLKASEIKITEAAVREIIRHYTREAGVRSLEREISKLCRKVVKDVLIKPSKKTVTISPRSLEKYLGVTRYQFGRAEMEDRIGQVTGLAWTEVGGDLLSIEAAMVPGKGKSIYTGRLGDVMQESIRAAMTVVRSRSAMLGIDEEIFQTRDFHIHVPEGATPKDGPSAGIAMCTTLVSAITNIPVHSSVAMTGEITLRGEVLPIGGLKEKLLAAMRGGIETVIIPKENEKDLKEIPQNITNYLNLRPVKWIDEVFEIALHHMPDTVSDTGVDKVGMPPKKKRTKKSSARKAH